MKFRTGLFILAALLFFQCERDDLCLEKPAVEMNTVFYNQSTQQRESVKLTVIFDGDTIVPTQQTDSLLIPLPVDQNSVKYLFVKDDSSGENTDTLLLQYQIEDQFVSKACGFKTIYKNLQIQRLPDGDNWIQQVIIEENNLTTDTINHVKIYF